jgi:hypothetical protein
VHGGEGRARGGGGGWALLLDKAQYGALAMTDADSDSDTGRHDTGTHTHTYTHTWHRDLATLARPAVLSPKERGEGAREGGGLEDGKRGRDRPGRTQL